MRMSEGVEWAVHTCLNLAWVGSAGPVRTARLAAVFDLPAPYLNKQLQALVRHGILTSTSGPKGGFRLARPPEQISFLDIVGAIEGPGEAFHCREIRQRGPFGNDPAGYRQPCAIAGVFAGAEREWRRQLASQTIADVARDVEEGSPEVPERIRQWLLEQDPEGVIRGAGNPRPI